MLNISEIKKNIIDILSGSKTEQKKQQAVKEAIPPIVLNINVLAEIVKEISLIRQLKEGSLKYNKEKNQYENEKGKKVKPENILRPTFATLKPKPLEQINQFVSNIKNNKGTGLSLLMLFALIASPTIRSFIWGALKEVLIGKDGILPDPMKKFIKLFVTEDKDNPTEQLRDVSEGIDGSIKEMDSGEKDIEKEKSIFEKVADGLASKIKPIKEKIDKLLEFFGVKEKPKQEQQEEQPAAQGPAGTEPAPPGPQGTRPGPAGTEPAPPGPQGTRPGPAGTQPAPPGPQGTRPGPAGTQPAPAGSAEIQQTGKVPVTTEEIKKFQEANGLKPDGVAGPMTIELMRKKGVYPSESGVKGLIIQELNKAGITSPAAIANIFATVKAESGFRSRSEEISEERANKNYGNNPGLGNKLPGDGYKFRGRGLIQHTGRAQYEVLSRASGLDLINNPDQLNDPAIAAKTIPWFFLKYKSFIIKSINDLDDIHKVNKAVAFHGVGNTQGEEYQRRVQSAQQYLTQGLGSVTPATTTPAPVATPVPSTPQTGATVAQQSADVVGAKKQEEAQKKVATNVAVVATNNTTVVPRKGTLKNTLTSPSAAM
jgi:putative chitinase